jgi:amino acid transporter
MLGPMDDIDAREQHAEPRAVDAAGEPVAGQGTEPVAEAPAVGWWHRDHPVFAALAGFFTGLVFVVVVPGAYAAVLAALLDYESAEELFPFVLVALAVPIALLVHPRTRRFGRYMLLGMVSTALVVGGVAALVLWFLVNG